MYCHRSRFVAFLLAVVTCILLSITPGLAQDYRGKVQGLVTDSSAGSLATATVTLLNTETGVSSVKQTDTNGQYLFDFVVPGNYTLTVELSGFDKAVHENVRVETRADVTVDFTLKVGGLSQQVTVTGSVAQVEFNTTTLSKTIDSKMLAQMPVLARNPFSLALLDPAVVNRYGAQRNPFYQLSTTGIDVGGQTSGRVDVLIDGVPIGVGSRGSYSPPMDAVQEFTIQQNSIDAEFGHTSGAVMNLSMKAGTNDYHGSLYYFGRNPALNAVSNSVSRTPNQVRNHVEGGTIGGPIIKNKLFTFFTYERWQNQQPHTTTMTLPTDLERTGDYSQSYTDKGALRTIYDPYSTLFNSTTGAVSRTPFPGNRIPVTQLDPTSMRFMKDIWNPNTAGIGLTHASNFNLTYPWNNDYWNLSDRTDWMITDKWRMFARYSVIRTRLDNPNYENSPAVPSDNGGLMDALNAAADTVYTLSAHTVLNFRMGVVYSEDDYNSEWAKLGASGLENYWPGNSWFQPYLKDLPAVYYPNLSIGNANFGKGAYWIYHPRKYSYQGSISMDRGQHYIKVGASFRHAYETSQLPNLGTFPFSAALTANTFVSPDTAKSGDPWATFLLGALDSTTKVNDVTPKNTTMNQYGFFFQDDYKVNRRITLNLGLRYEYESAPVEAQDRLTRYLDLTNPIPEMQSNPPVVPSSVSSLNNVPYQYNGAWVYADSSHRGMYDPPRNLFLPRAGIAFKINDKTVLRAGYARFAIPLESIFGYAWNLPANDGFNASTTASPVLQGVPTASLSDPFPSSNPLILPVGKSLGRYTNLGAAGTWVPQHFDPPINDRYQISLQRQILNSTVLELTYFTNMGHNLPPQGQGGNAGYGLPLNMSDPALSYQYQGALSATVANPFYNYLTPQLFPGQLRNQKTVAVGSLLVPYPQYGVLTQDMMNGIEDRYHSFQLRLQRTFSNGLSFLSGYNYQRERESAFFNADDQYADKLTMQPITNPRHRISIAGTYQLPFGKGRLLMSNAPRIVDLLLGGWSTSQIFQWNSGSYLQFGQMKVSGNPVISDPTKDRWFDTSVFSKADAYTPRTNPWTYSGLTGPGYWNIDSTLAKEFPLTERFRLELRIEAYNATNSFMAGNPGVDVLNPALFGKSTTQANTGREMQYTLRLHF